MIVEQGREVVGLPQGALVNYHLLRLTRVLSTMPLWGQWLPTKMFLFEQSHLGPGGKWYADGLYIQEWNVVDADTRTPKTKKGFVKIEEVSEDPYFVRAWQRKPVHVRNVNIELRLVAFCTRYAMAIDKCFGESPLCVVDPGSGSGRVMFYFTLSDGREYHIIKTGATNHRTRLRKKLMGRSLPKTKVIEASQDLQARLPGE